jgi:hypothetical protein
MASKQKMSVTQALAELKLLDKRIRSLTSEHMSEMWTEANLPSWIKIKTKQTPVDLEAHKKDCEADWQSFMALVNRRYSIKKAIVVSNATTVVKIGEWEGTVAEAIEHKQSIRYKKDLLEICQKIVAKGEREYKEKQDELQGRLDSLLQSELGKDVKTNPDTLQQLTVTFTENNKIEKSDPLKVNERIQQLKKEVEEFELNVDWVLSEANGRTIIEIA